MSDATPVMGTDERRESEQLSLASLRPPLRIPGYEQERFLGRGSFGEVWVAVDSNSGRSVAIKYYNRKGSIDWGMLAREVEKLQHLFSDRYVVQLLAVGWNADPPYYVMEYMEAGSLEDRLKAGPMAEGQAVAMVREVAQGLVHAHGKGILHCDLKPGNVLLDQDGRPRLADFGQARLSHEQAPSLGTLYFMAPEQADLKGVPDARWDVYALGALLYCMLTGGPPYRSEEAREGEVLKAPTLAGRLEAYRRLLSESPRPAAHRQVPGVDAALAEVVDRCLAIDPKHRYPNVQAVLDALDARTLKRARLPLLILGGVAPALVVLVLALMGWWFFDGVVTTAKEEVTERAEDGNTFAAQAVAGRFALEIDRRWGLLEREAADPELVAHLDPIGQLASRLPGPNGAEKASRGHYYRFKEWEEQQAWLQGWITRRHAAHEARFTPKTRVESWFILDRAGVNVGRSPPDDAVTGASWSHRDYFHGEWRDYPRGEERRKPFPGPHRSVVFRSTATGKLTVAFSVPVWGKGPGAADPIGVLAMTSQLGHFAEWEGSENQTAALIDTKADGNSRRGRILEHALLDTAREDCYVRPEIVDESDQARERERANLARQFQGLPRSGERSPYRGPFDDPLKPGDRTWLVALEPVIVARSRDEIIDTYWTVLVQQEARGTADSSGVLDPVRALYGKLWRAALAALVVVLALVGGLWWFVVLVLDQSADSPLIRTLRKRLGLSSGGLRSGSSGSSGSLPRSGATPRPSGEPPTVLSTDKPIEPQEGPWPS